MSKKRKLIGFSSIGRTLVSKTSINLLCRKQHRAKMKELTVMIVVSKRKKLLGVNSEESKIVVKVKN